MLFNNQQEALKELVKNGPYSEVFPADRLERAVLGYIGIKVVDNEEVTFDVEWPIFKTALEPSVSVVEAEELMDFVIHNPNVVKCDSPRQLLIGFALYDEKQGISIVKRCRITKLKEFMSKFSIFEEKIETSIDNRLKEAVAVMEAANNSCLRELILK